MMPAMFRSLSRFNDQPYLLLVLATLLWGGNVIAGRIAVGQISPMAVTCLRWFLVCAILAATRTRQIGAEWRLLLPYWQRLLLLGTTGFTFFNALFYVAAHYTTGVNMAVLQGSFLIYVLVGTALVFGTRVTAWQVIGIFLTIVGVIAVATKGEPGTLLRFAFNRGDLMMMAATALYTVYTLALRGRPNAAPIVMFAALSGVAFVTSLPLLAWEIASGGFMVPTPTGLAALAYVAVGPSLLGQLFYIRGVELMGPNRASTFYNLVPIFGALLSVLVLDESFRPYHALAFILVIGGIWVAERKAAKTRQSKSGRKSFERGI